MKTDFALPLSSLQVPFSLANLNGVKANPETTLAPSYFAVFANFA
jgi:hypothetical protein